MAALLRPLALALVIGASAAQSPPPNFLRRFAPVEELSMLFLVLDWPESGPLYSVSQTRTLAADTTRLLRERTHGRWGRVHLDVAGPVTMPKPRSHYATTGWQYDLWKDALDAARAAGIATAGHRGFAFVTERVWPRIVAGDWAGYSVFLSNLDPFLAVHEIGHTYELGHTDRLNPTTGLLETYGDESNFMGLVNTKVGIRQSKMFYVPHAVRLGFLEKSQIVEPPTMGVGSARVYVLSARELGFGTVGVRLRVSGEEADWFVTYRAKQPVLRNGVVLTRSSLDTATRSYIIDASPGADGDHLRQGHTFNEPSGAFSIHVLAVNAEMGTATIRVAGYVRPGDDRPPFLGLVSPSRQTTREAYTGAVLWQVWAYDAELGSTANGSGIAGVTYTLWTTTPSAPTLVFRAATPTQAFLLDTTRIPNDYYHLTIEATELSGRSSEMEVHFFVDNP